MTSLHPSWLKARKASSSSASPSMTVLVDQEGRAALSGCWVDIVFGIDTSSVIPVICPCPLAGCDRLSISQRPLWNQLRGLFSLNDRLSLGRGLSQFVEPT